MTCFSLSHNHLLNSLSCLESDRFDTGSAGPCEAVLHAGRRPISSYLVWSAQALSLFLGYFDVAVSASPVDAHRWLPARSTSVDAWRRVDGAQSQQRAGFVTLGTVAARIAGPEPRHQPNTQPDELAPPRRLHVARHNAAQLQPWRHRMWIYVGTGRRGRQLERTSELI